jgi:hypothetical protein
MNDVLTHFPAGWYAVGSDDADGLPEHWPRHRRYCSAFAVHQETDENGQPEVRPFLTFERFMEVCASGRYRRARASDAEALRPPDKIVGSDPPAAGRYGRVLTGLTWREADVVCRLAGGRLATETEAAILCREIALDRPAPAWTAQRWSEWRGRLIGYGRLAGSGEEDWFVPPEVAADVAFHDEGPHAVVAPGEPPSHRSFGTGTEAGAWFVVNR